MDIKIENSTIHDIEAIFAIYDKAAQLQEEKGSVVWPLFERKLIVTEISEKRQWKMLIEGEIACVWAITYQDPQIWGARDDGSAIYIHRIATNPKFRGNNLVLKIIEWAKDHAINLQKSHIRMDTAGNNEALIRYYQKCGFKLLGLSKLSDAEGLPAHYQDAEVCLFEMEV